MNNSGIIRNKLKICAAVTNARKFLEVQEEFEAFQNISGVLLTADLLIINRKLYQKYATTEISDKISKDLKKRGFKFVGSTVIYAHMQATGMVNDHIETCFIRK
jgi:DNA-3-methyladenine glycosylase I